MIQEIIMPKLGLSMKSGILVEWHKKQGDEVKKGEVVAGIETDKIVTQVESQVDGFIIELLVEEGDEVPISQPICIVADEKEAKSETQKHVGEKQVSVKISPLARRIAKEHNIDIELVKTDKGKDRISKEDILSYLEIRNANMPADSSSEGKVNIASENKNDIIKTEKLSGIRKIIAERLTESKRNIPHAYFEISVNMDQALNLKESLNKESSDKHKNKLTINDIIIKACINALGKNKGMNVSLQNGEILRYEKINLGVAVDTKRGLLVPAIKDLESKNLFELTDITHAAIRKAREGTLEEKDISGAVFTISNLGGYGIDAFTAIINPPESAILAVGNIKQTPTVISGEIKITNQLRITLSVDHRLIDGALAAEFLADIKAQLEMPYLLMV